MTRRPQGSDDTVRVARVAAGMADPPPGPGARRAAGGRFALGPVAVLVAAAAAGGAIGAFWILLPARDRGTEAQAPPAARRAEPPEVARAPAEAAPRSAPAPWEAAGGTPRAAPPPPLPAAVEPAPPPPPGSPPLFREAALATLLPATPTMVRLEENPQVFVLVFPDLESQGAALNRVAALVEKAGLPRDRVVGRGELSDFLSATGEQPATWYYGHDYAGAAIARFFALAERDGIPLEAGELWLREQYRIARAVADPAREVALISAPNPDARLDPAMRATILRHEIGHGHFFTRPEVAAHVMRVWTGRFTEDDRTRFRRFLGREGYDTRDDRLMANEAMAYLLFTPDPRFFTASHLGTDLAGLERLRRMMEEGWPPP